MYECVTRFRDTDSRLDATRYDSRTILSPLPPRENVESLNSELSVARFRWNIDDETRDFFSRDQLLRSSLKIKVNWFGSLEDVAR